MHQVSLQFGIRARCVPRPAAEKIAVETLRQLHKRFGAGRGDTQAPLASEHAISDVMTSAKIFYSPRLAEEVKRNRFRTEYNTQDFRPYRHSPSRRQWLLSLLVEERKPERPDRQPEVNGFHFK
jgi:hypothetical protein